MLVDDDSDKWFNDKFFQALREIDMKSVPGLCPLKQLGTTNAQVFGSREGIMDLERVITVRNLVKLRFDSIIKGGGEADHLLCFPKVGPIKKTKTEKGLTRLISAVSLVDTLIDRVLFSSMVDKFLASSTTNPIFVGWNPIIQTQIFYHRLRHNGKWLAADKSSWDWTVKGWLIDLVKAVIIELHPLAPKWWLTCVHFRFKKLFDEAVWQFQDGTIAYQQERGIVKSGCYLTIWINSISQMLIHEIAIARCAIPSHPYAVLGDDTIQAITDWQVEDYIKSLKALGFIVKYKVLDEPEFAGFYLSRYSYVPAYRDKHCYALRRMVFDETIATTTLKSYQLLYANCDEVRGKIVNLIKERNLPQACIDPLTLALIQNR